MYIKFFNNNPMIYLDYKETEDESISNLIKHIQSKYKTVIFKSGSENPPEESIKQLILSHVKT
jgi:hypothetical protein